MVKAAPDVLYSGGEVATRAAQAATSTLPIVAVSSDLVAEKLVASLARPGANITGVSILAPELDGKRLDILLEACPTARRVAVLADANTTPARHLQSLKDAAQTRGVELLTLAVGKREEIAPAMEHAKAEGAGALSLLASPLFGAYPNRAIVVEVPTRLGLPAIYEWPEIAEEGGFLSYGPRFTGIFRQVARLAVKVLHGSKPSEIPAEQPTHFELVVNLKTAKAIGREIPAGVLLRADKIIE